MQAKTLLALVAVLAVGSSVAHAQPPADPPAEAKKLLDEMSKDVKAIRAKARKEVVERQEKTIEKLAELQEGYTKEAKKDEAAAVGRAIQLLKDENAVLSVAGTVQADPGDLTGFRDKVGKSFYFRVTGTTDGEVWGTGVYTDDSALAAAAVHAGLVKSGETRVVKVTIAAGEASYTGSAANGVTTGDYGDWEGSFKVEAVKAGKAGKK